MVSVEVFRAVEALAHEVYWQADHGTVDDELALADPQIEVEAPTGASVGLEEYRRLLEHRRTAGGRSYHSISNLRVVSADAEGVAYTFLITNYLRDRRGVGPGDRIALAVSEDAAVWRDGVLKLTRRRVRPLMIWGEPADAAHG